MSQAASLLKKHFWIHPCVRMTNKRGPYWTVHVPVMSWLTYSYRPYICYCVHYTLLFSLNVHRTRTLECDEKECGEFTVMHLGYLRYTHYIITVNFYGLSEIQQWYNVEDVVFHVSSSSVA